MVFKNATELPIIIFSPKTLHFLWVQGKISKIIIHCLQAKCLKVRRNGSAPRKSGNSVLHVLSTFLAPAWGGPGPRTRLGLVLPCDAHPLRAQSVNLPGSIQMTWSGGLPPWLDSGLLQGSSASAKFAIQMSPGLCWHSKFILIPISTLLTSPQRTRTPQPQRC